MLFNKYYTGNKLIIYTSIVKNKKLFIAYIDSENIHFILYDTNKNITKLPYTIPLVKIYFLKNIVCDNECNIYVINHITNMMHIIFANGEQSQNIEITNPIHLYRVKNSIYCLHKSEDPQPPPPPFIILNNNSQCNDCNQCIDCYDSYILSKFDLTTGKFIPVITNIQQFVIDCTSDTLGNLYLSFFPNEGTTLIKKYSSNGNIINDNFITFSNDCFIINIIIDSNDNIYLFKLTQTDVFTSVIEKYNSKGVITEIIYNHKGDTYIPETYTFMTLDKNDNLYYSDYNSVYKHIITPVSNICFLGDTPVNTDQGVVFIENIDPDINTIRNMPILAITKTITKDSYLVCFEKHSLYYNYPNNKTVMTKDHKIWYNGIMYEAGNFLGRFNNVYTVKYNGELLYNILMEKHECVEINNMFCETLHPENIISRLYRSGVDEEMKKKIVTLMNDATNNKDYATYNRISSYL